jgi:hypothetical protein
MLEFVQQKEMITVHSVITNLDPRFMMQECDVCVQGVLGFSGLDCASVSYKQQRGEEVEMEDIILHVLSIDPFLRASCETA